MGDTGEAEGGCVDRGRGDGNFGKILSQICEQTGGKGEGIWGDFWAC